MLRKGGKLKVNVQQINHAMDIIASTRNKLYIQISELENVALSFNRLGYSEEACSLVKYREYLYCQCDKLHILSLSLGSIIDCYIKVEQDNISYICEEIINYKNRECGMINLQGVRDIMREMKFIGGDNGDIRI